MKEELMLTVADLREQGIDLEETPAFFEWSYQEEPFVKFQLLIKEVSQLDSTTVH